ncbi:MAG: carbamoyltransferase HypF [Lewinellaceae bacterium]|nr:carbamoyltransferase HypF [Lewinellaceae bacterium]
MNCTFFIRITGQVQGVGFRPFVYQQAGKYRLKGWVNNSLEGVHIQVSGEAEAVEAFIRALREEKPSVAQINEFSAVSVPYQSFSSFEIVKSNREGSGQLVLTPDLALCPSCRAELHDPGNRRFRYPFITCNYCGPRYSLLKGLPYDRELTTMDPFTMCPDCRKEYDDPAEWRFFSQTNSCATCGVSLALYDRTFRLLETASDPAIARVAQAIRDGQIVAVKGIGGYLLLCDACNPEAIQTLRARKGRARKPFAVMYPGLEAAASDVALDSVREAALTGPASPIVLAYLRLDRKFPVCIEQLAPGLDQLGVMIPYAPLFELILAELGMPVVATSANRSASPIVYGDDRALSELSPMADLILVHDREIAMPQDDSVLRLSKYHDQPILHRRSRGLAPAFVHPPFEGLPETVLAMGADMKSAFGFLHRTFAYVSQYFGDLDSFDTQERFRRSRDHFLGLFEARPSVVLVDRHPQYFSTQLGREFAEEKAIPFLEVQHHIAHFAAVLGENHLLDAPAPVLGVIWDGTGMGTDGQIWGGEFFRYEEGRFSRCGQLDYFDMILGDKMPREPRIAAMSAALGVPGSDELLRPKFNTSEWFIYQKLLQRPNNLKTSSMGRLFDAVAALLGILDVAEYEGEAPLYVEQQARIWFEREGLDFEEAYAAGELYQGRIDTRILLGALVADMGRGEPRAKIAARFHNTLVRIVGQISEQMQLSRLAFSGGVFQNELLVDLLIHRLGETRQLYFHRQLSPNDECISFGQLSWYYILNVLFPEK